jgi:GTP-binding protein
VFSDRVTIHVEAGRGGDGSLAFRREKFVPRGGPAGGDGGHGGDVVLVADPDLRDLTALRYAPHVRARSGAHGEGSQKTGGTGEDTIVRVPVGTQVFGEDEALACDLAHAGARVVIARGGRGGAGNRRFTTATRQAPRIAGVGEEGETRTLELHLKLLADAALLGFPNVGKSSLLRRISNATPKVADYPFTTIEPVLGTVDASDGHQLTVVDVPGLLEGASDGVGLGHEFLAHLERARLLIHTVPADEVAADLEAARDGFQVIYGELEAHGHGLAERPRIVVLNKIDLVAPDERAALVESFADAVAAGDRQADGTVVIDDERGRPVVLGVSCATGEGVPALVAALFRHAPQRTDPVVADDGLADYLVYRPGASGRARFRLFREEGGFRVSSTAIEEAAEGLDPDDENDAQRLSAVLDNAGVIGALKRAGAKEGDEIKVGSLRFTYVPEKAVE